METPERTCDQCGFRLIMGCHPDKRFCDVKCRNKWHSLASNRRREVDRVQRYRLARDCGLPVCEAHKYRSDAAYARLLERIARGELHPNTKAAQPSAATSPTPSDAASAAATTFAGNYGAQAG